MAEKTISVKAGYYRLTVINGERTVLDNKAVIESGYSNLKSFTVDTDLQTVITITLPKHYGVSAYPVLDYYPQYDIYIESYEEFEQINASTFTLTTTFENLTNSNMRIALKCSSEVMYAYIYTELTDCICNVQSGIALPAETTFTLTCNTDREFQITPHIEYAYGNEIISEYFDKVNDVTYSKTINLIRGRDYLVKGETVKKTVIIDKYGLITAYRVTKDELRRIAKIRFIERKYEPVKVDGTIVLYNANDEPIDTAKYIVSLIRLNIPINTSIKERLFFGPYDMGIDCDIIENDIITLNFGAVEVHGIYGNAIDYEHTEISLYLPYIGFVTLNTSNCMNKTISLSYQVNVLNGEALAIISADNQVIETHSCDISIKIPYQLSGGEKVYTEIEPNTNYLHDTNPFMYIRTHIATQPERMPYHDTNIYSVLGDLSGYTEATEIAFKVLSDHITTTEIDEIKSLIAGGIVI